MRKKGVKLTGEEEERESDIDQLKKKRGETI